MHDYFYTVALIITVNFLICGLDKLLEHLARHKQRILGAPIIMVEKRVRLPVSRNPLGKLKLILRDIIDKLMHESRLFIEIDHAVFHAHKVVQFLKDTVKIAGCGESLLAVNRGGNLSALLPG